jgi:hypothetical protein
MMLYKWYGALGSNGQEPDPRGFPVRLFKLPRIPGFQPVTLCLSEGCYALATSDSAYCASCQHDWNDGRCVTLFCFATAMQAMPYVPHLCPDCYAEWLAGTELTVHDTSAR